MLREDLTDRFEVGDDELDGMLVSVEEKKLVKLHRDARGKVTHAKATYDGLRKMYPPEYYQWYPEWAIREKGLLL